MTYSVTRRFQFCAGHRVFKHESKCAHPHGHNYILLATFAPTAVFGDGLDPLGRVIDFSVIKSKLGEWIDTNWDHGFIYFSEDEVIKDILFPHNFKMFEMDSNPTAENMANFILHVVCPTLFADSDVHCIKVELWETENCKAEVTL